MLFAHLAVPSGGIDTTCEVGLSLLESIRIWETAQMEWTFTFATSLTRLARDPT